MSGSEDMYEETDDIFNQMVEEFKIDKNKRNLIQIMTDYCSKETTTPEQIYDLKKKLEIDFSKKVDCNYCYAQTPIDYGCDLREIFYDRNNTLIEGGEYLLNIFESKKLPDIWHIMTDIDDTLYPNNEHGTYIAGSDSSWRQKVPYPGIKLFYYLFYKKIPINSDYSTILSATPGCLKTSKLHDKKRLLHSVLKNYGFIQGPESKSRIFGYTGDILSNCVGHYCGTANNTSLFTLFGNTKFERFKQYISIFPEYKILFIGDNGQGDVLAGTRMIEYDDRCHVFIHKVSEDGRTFKTVPEEGFDDPRLNFFKNYYEVALKFKELGIFTDDDAEKINHSISTQITSAQNSRFAHLYFTGGTRKIRNRKRKSKKMLRHKFTYV